LTTDLKIEIQEGAYYVELKLRKTNKDNEIECIRATTFDEKIEVALELAYQQALSAIINKEQ
jgi:hypothetical protein